MKTAISTTIFRAAAGLLLVAAAATASSMPTARALTANPPAPRPRQGEPLAKAAREGSYYDPYGYSHPDGYGSDDKKKKDKEKPCFKVVYQRVTRKTCPDGGHLEAKPYEYGSYQYYYPEFHCVKQIPVYVERCFDKCRDIPVDCKKTSQKKKTKKKKVCFEHVCEHKCEIVEEFEEVKYPPVLKVVDIPVKVPCDYPYSYQRSSGGGD